MSSKEKEELMNRRLTKLATDYRREKSEKQVRVGSNNLDKKVCS